MASWVGIGELSHLNLAQGSETTVANGLQGSPKRETIHPSQNPEAPPKGFGPLKEEP